MSESYVPERAKTPAEWAEHFGHKATNAMKNGEAMHHVFWYARLAGSFAAVALEKDAQASRNAAHRDEVNRAFQTLSPQTWFSLQDVADQKLTDYLVKVDAHLGAVES